MPATRPPDPPPVIHYHRRSQAMRSWGIVLVTVGGIAALIGGLGAANGICTKSTEPITCDPAGFNYPLIGGLVAIGAGITMIIYGSKRVADSPTVSIHPGGASLTAHF